MKRNEITNGLDKYGRVKCIDQIRRKRESCIGYCNLVAHRGFVTEELLREHQCISKGCTFLERVDDHPYWIRKVSKKEWKAEAKRIQNKEKAILEEANRHFEASKQANKLVSKKAEAVFCKHLQDSLYILCVIHADFLATQGLYSKIKSKLGVRIKIKEIKEWQLRNIEYTYIVWLDEATQQKIRQGK